jgi:hypothetical protein
LIAEAGGEALDQARESLMERFSHHQKDGFVQMGARVHIITGARSSPH